ncbi:zinc knuckle (CCHC-type) family [Chlorella sorokiniana]|uniref:Zinc knuckle (CCHC-type) family n=1 Tax=Chlorella sorokiniana TaxID=3076 RepID=A0A2P6U358_CHLSO|nr:zinc knuckle (CCHC-type) family [Chlorella sorokiniana]|eukprot:PRW60741.1 zinc knuckle (CCHC-type) family [Chlorella sorokiniana]
MEGSYGMFNPDTDAKAAEGAPQKPQRRMPGRGVLDGIRQDLKAAKETGESYDPRGTGAAWTHNFLQKKPWHPLTFRNMARVYEKEQEHYEEEKRKAESRAEFEAEQAYLKTLSLLSPEEQEKYRQRQSVSFLYMKPPGYDAALERAEKAQQAGQAVGAGGEPLAGGAAAGSGAAAQQQQQGGQQQQQRGRAPPPGGHMKAVLGGIKAVAQQAQQRYELKHVSGTGMGRSPPRGGTSAAGDELQQFVVGEMDSEEEEEAIRLAAIPPDERRRMQRAAAKAKRKEEKAAAAAQLDQAKAFLRAAGLALPSDDEGGGGSGSEDSSSSSDSSSSDGEGGGRGKRRRRSGSKERKRGRERRGGKERKDKKRRKEKKKKKRRGKGD